MRASNQNDLSPLQPKGLGGLSPGFQSSKPAKDKVSVDARGPGAGRAKLRLSRGFPVVLALQHHPRQILSGLLDHFAAPEQDAELRVLHLTRTNDLRGRRRKRVPRGKPPLRRSFALPEPCLLRQPIPYF